MKLMGHRGARDKAPENTLRSFSHLIEAGIPAVEFDIHESADGVWVVHHDDTLERTTKGTGHLSSKSWAELCKIETHEGDPLPRLEQVLEIFKNTSMELQIELKSPGNYQALAQVLRSSIDVSKITIISFNHRWLFEFKNSAPDIRTTCLLFGLPMNPVEIVKSAKAQGLSLSVNWIDTELVQACHQAGFTVTAWNANDPETYQEMKALGIDYLGTDKPFTARGWSKS
ncbi:phosphodiesterase [Bdellovibrio bacteriovorus]|uniref:Phosphodiesterase n=1 Tax=Bdellovibrio bacteriovorus TaxID=959 RepID=A0A150WST6_BDEBC|nr:glycerophosphodiester phosphodiesterase [Bdellovibrio bacteriovorus]KYG67543.1 phosphodiesterase [Bdellovibrio bacteriovorus]